MVQDTKVVAGERMEKAITALRRELATIRAGRAMPSLLDKITIEYYGSSTPINQLANISAPEPRLLVIQPWDKKTVADIERAIFKSDLGLTPNSDGTVIRLGVPQLTEERRQELAKIVRKKAEETRVAIRNVRRDINEEIKKKEKSGEITEDGMRKTLEEMQKMTDKYIEEVEKVMANKEREIMEV